MQLEVGQILEGKVTGITKFGAFVSLPDGQSGLVHISEVANTYVSDVSQHYSSGDSVKVKVIGIAGDGKINLSIKKALPDERPAPRAQPFRATRNGDVPHGAAPHGAVPRGAAPRGVPARGYAASEAREPSFEDKLRQFMQDADNRISGNRHYADKKSSRKRRD